MTRRLVTIYGPRGERLIEPTLLDVAAAIAGPAARILPVLERVNLQAGGLNFVDAPLVSRLLDHRGEPIFSGVL